MSSITVNIPDGEKHLFKKMMQLLGYDLPNGQAKAAGVERRPLTKIQQDFVDGYREMVEADRGGKPLGNFEDFIKELKEEEEARNGEPVKN